MNALKNVLVRLLSAGDRRVRFDLSYVVASSFWINLNFVFVSACSLALSVAFAYFLPKEEYGTYQYILAIAAFLTAFTFTGMNSAIAQAVARGREGVLRSTLRTQLLWNMLPGGVAILMSGYYLLHGNEVLAFGTLCVGLTLPVINAYNSYTAFLTGRKQFQKASLYAIAGNTCYYVLIFGSIFLVPTAGPLVAVNLFTSALIAFVLYRRTIRTFKPNNEKDTEAVSYGRHLSIMNVLGVIANSIDKVLVFHFMGAATLAAYGLATLLPERLAGGFKAVLLAALPRFTEHDLASIRGSIGAKLGLAAGATLTCALIYYLAAPFVLSFLYPAYAEIIPYSQVYALTFTNTVGQLIVIAFLAHKRLRELYVLNTAVPLFQIVAQVAGILFWGLWGLIIARVLSSLLSALIGILLLRSVRQHTPEFPSNPSAQVV